MADNLNLAEKLKDYNFTDEDDNPLEMCNEYQRLVSEHGAMFECLIWIGTELLKIPVGEVAEIDSIRERLKEAVKDSIDSIAGDKNNLVQPFVAYFDSLIPSEQREIHDYVWDCIEKHQDGKDVVPQKTKSVRWFLTLSKEERNFLFTYRNVLKIDSIEKEA